MIGLNLLFAVYFLTGISQTFATNETKYEPTWKSLDKRPLPQWYDEAKFGIFLHWGVYSVPSFYNEWFWEKWNSGNKEIVNFMKQNYPPNFTYQDFAPQFKAEFFNPKEWTELFKKAGARYVTLTTKHHEGFCLWPAPRSYSWNSVDVGPKRDLVGDLSAALREAGLKVGLYHSLFEWYNPIFNSDKTSHYKKDDFVQHKLNPERLDLVHNYKPDLWWSDGDEHAPDSYWKSKEFIAWLYNESPVKDTIVVNDRWGTHDSCHHGDFWTCHDGYDPGHLVHHKWESAITLVRGSWGYVRNANLKDVRTIKNLIAHLARTVSCGGNLHLDVGPTPDGRIEIIAQERLLQIGQWLKINGEAIYKSRPWTYQYDTKDKITWYTSQPTAVYAITTKWPVGNKLKLFSVFKEFKNGSIQSVTLLGNSEKLKYKVLSDSVEIEFPDKATVESQWAWTLKFLLTKHQRRSTMTKT